MVGVETRDFKRGIDKKRALENAEVFFASPLGQKILSARHGERNPFHVCIRDNYFNIYWNGCSVLKFSPNASKNVYTIHHKYVHGENGKADTYLSLESNGQVMIDDLSTGTRNGWSFVKDIIDPAIEIGNIPLLEKYASKSDDERPKEKALLKSYLEGEKRPFLLDLEIAFSRLNGESKPVADRIDMAEIVYDENGTPVLKLVEVKAFDDPRLRANREDDLRSHEKKIMCQMNLYQQFIHDEELKIQRSYRTVAANMLKFGFDKFMNGLGSQSASEVLRDFLTRGVVDSKPHLLVLTDKKDRDEAGQQFQRLQKVIAEKYPALRLIQVGKG